MLRRRPPGKAATGDPLQSVNMEGSRREMLEEINPLDENKNYLHQRQLYPVSATCTCRSIKTVRTYKFTLTVHKHKLEVTVLYYLPCHLSTATIGQWLNAVHTNM